MVTHQVQLFGSEKMSLWESLVGYAKREMAVQDGHVYFMQRNKNMLTMSSMLRLSDLFKVFVDP